MPDMRSVMQGRLLSIAVLVTLAALVVFTPIAGRGASGDEATFCLGFILIFAFFLSRTLKGVALPEISGYILAGVLCGPYALNILSHDVVRSLQTFDDVALAIIALIAGGEMRMSYLKKSKNSIFGVIVGQTLFSFAGAILVVFALMGTIGFLHY